MRLSYLQEAQARGLVRFEGEGRGEAIRYLPSNHKERWSDPEEKVRAEFWAELIVN